MRISSCSQGGRRARDTPQVTREDTTMSENRSLNEDPSSVQAHLTIMQGVIQRMAENSRP